MAVSKIPTENIMTSSNPLSASSEKVTVNTYCRGFRAGRVAIIHAQFTVNTEIAAWETFLTINDDFLIPKHGGDTSGYKGDEVFIGTSGAINASNYKIATGYHAVDWVYIIS